MKTNWQTKKLGEICNIEIGKTPSRSNKKLWDIEKITKNVWLSIRDLSNAEGRIISDSREYISDKAASSLSLVEKGTLLVSFKLTLGRLAFAGKNLYTNEAIAALNIKDEKEISKEYLYQYLSYFDWDAATKGDVKVKGKTLNKAKLKEIEIVYPPLPEQKQIVRIIHEAFEKLEKVKENTEKNIQNSLNLFESYSRVAFDNPGNWTNKILGEVCNLYQGIAINAKTRHALVEKSDLPLLRIKDLRHNTVEQYIDPNNFPKNALVNESDLIYTRTGQIGLVFTGKRGVLHNNSFKIVPSDTLSREYLFYWLQNPTFKSKIVDLASRAAQPDITHTLFKQQPISIPSLPEQKSIVKNLDQLSKQTKKLESIYQSKLSSIEELKKSILSKAFSKGL